MFKKLNAPFPVVAASQFVQESEQGISDLVQDTNNGFGIKDIYLLDLNTGVESQITDGASYNFHPSISGDRIVWVKSIDNMGSILYNIYVYDLNLGVKTLISSTDANVIIHPDIDGNRIVWEDIRNGNRDIYMATIN